MEWTWCVHTIMKYYPKPGWSKALNPNPNKSCMHVHVLSQPPIYTYMWVSLYPGYDVITFALPELYLCWENIIYIFHMTPWLLMGMKLILNKRDPGLANKVCLIYFHLIIWHFHKKHAIYYIYLSDWFTFKSKDMCMCLETYIITWGVTLMMTCILYFFL